MLKYYQTAMLSLSNTILKYNIILRTSLCYNNLKKGDDLWRRNYSYAKLALNISLAYKKLSEIVNELRFGLEFLELVNEYKEFEMEYRLKNKK